MHSGCLRSARRGTSTVRWMREPGPLIASGRDADIFDYGPGLVLRRSRSGRSLTGEAQAMVYARDLGYPVPAVDKVSEDGTDLVMERVEGPSMVGIIARQPWTVRRQGRSLAGLHHRLHEIRAPEWLSDAPCGSGDRLVHLDLHPLNVIVSRKGPVVIDWSGASRGDGDVDAALAWILMACGGIPFGKIRAALLGWGRALLVNAFLSACDLTALRQALLTAVGWKLLDRNMTESERSAMRRLVASGLGPD
jgi:phosphotransferase family enzyme